MNDAPLTLELLKSRWVEVLDLLERQNRISWMVFFDARLVSLDNGILRLSFADAEKFSGAHDFGHARKPELKAALESAIYSVLGVAVEIIAE